MGIAGRGVLSSESPAGGEWESLESGRLHHGRPSRAERPAVDWTLATGKSLSLASHFLAPHLLAFHFPALDLLAW